MPDKRTYIRVHDGMDEHPKIDPLSDKAFRWLFKSWFWCSRNKTDGRMPTAVWTKRATAKVRAELVAAGLVEIHEGYVQMHDYLEHQRSAEQIAEAVEKKQRGARLGNHRRWHVKGVTDPECEFCPPGESGSPGSSDIGSHDRSDMRSDTDQSCDDEGAVDFGNESNLSNAKQSIVSVANKSIRSTGPEANSGTKTSSTRQDGPRPVSHTDRMTDRKPIANSSTEDRGQRTDKEELTLAANVPESRRARDEPRPTPADLAATAHSPTAFRLVHDYAATCRKRPPSSVLTDLAVQVDALLAENWTPDELGPVIAAWGAKGLHPKVLASVAHEVTNRNPAGQQPATSSRRMDKALGYLAPDDPLLTQLTDTPPALTIIEGGQTA